VLIAPCQTDFNLMEWIATQSPAVTRPRVDAVISHLKEQGVTRFGAIGYCFGGAPLST